MIADNDNTPFSELTGSWYDMIMADPPWLFKLRSEKNLLKSPQGKYRCMPLPEIKRLPVADLAARDSLLWLWTTNPMIDQGLEVLKHWGFTFKTAGHWAKITKTGKQSFGPGYILRCAGEPFLIGTRGKPKATKAVRSVILGLIREHSRKPEEAYREAEKLMPDARRLDLFTRQTRQGWTPWGDEATKFDAPTLPFAAAA